MTGKSDPWAASTSHLSLHALFPTLFWTTDPVRASSESLVPWLEQRPGTRGVRPRLLAVAVAQASALGADDGLIDSECQSISTCRHRHVGHVFDEPMTRMNQRPVEPESESAYSE
jgi:hypothetical protein